MSKPSDSVGWEEEEAPVSANNPSDSERLAMLTLSIIDDLRSGQPLDVSKFHDAEMFANRVLNAHLE